MKPYYQDDYCTIYNGDCRDILPLLEPVDLVLTDPPYGVGWQSNWREDTFDKIKGDDVVTTDWLKLLQAQDIYCFTKWTVLQKWIDAFESIPIKVRDVLVWDKKSHGAGNLNSWAPCYELIIFASVYSPKLLNERSQNVLRHTRVDAGASGMASGKLLNHPAEKPVELLIDIAQKYIGTILDPFMGSGTTLRAAKDLGRKAIGIEIEEKYCQIAVKRLQQEVFNFNQSLKDIGGKTK